MFSKVLATLATVAIGFTATQAMAQPAPLPAGVTAGPSIEGVSEYGLANGMRVLLIPDRSVDTVTTNVTYLVGSRHEGYGEAGMAHLLEHLLFKGTPGHPNIKGEFLQRGARFNGTTSYDRTNYFQTIPSSDEGLAWSIELEADRMVNSRVSKTDLDSEMTVVRNEFESGENSPYGVLRERMAATAYLWHNYGRAIIGSRSDIENVPIDRLQAFYRHYYQPDNAVLIISGKFEPAKALDLVARHFGRIAKPTRTLRATYTREPTQDGERQVVLRRVGNIQIVSAMYHIAPGTHADYPALDMLVSILNHVPAGRLHKALVQTGQAVNIFGGERQQHEAGSATFGASVAQGASLDTARDTLLRVLEGIAKTPLTNDEVERARKQLSNEIEKVTNDTRSLGIVMSDIVALGDWRFLFWYRDQLPKVTLADVQRVALSYLKPQNRTLGMFIPTDKPDRAEVPSAPDLAAVLKDFRGRAEVAAGEQFDPSPENIEKRLIRKTLPGGMKLALLPKKTRGETVMAQLVLHWGDEQSTKNRSAACSMAGSLLMRGTTARTREQLRDALDSLRAQASVSADGASIDTIAKSLPETLRIVAEMLRTPAFPEQEFEQLRQQALANIDNQRTDPGALASLQISRHLNPYPLEHWFYTPSLEEREQRLRSLKIADVRQCHADFFGASTAELAVVGDFEPDAITGLVEQLFGDWKNPRPFVRIPAKFHDVSSLDRLIETPDKANAVYRAGMNIRVHDDDPDFPALILANYIFGGSSDSRLMRRVREKEGLSYSVGSWINARWQDQAGEFGVSAIHAPQNRARVEAAIADEIQRMLKDGFSKEEVDIARNGLLQARHVARNQDGALTARIAGYLFQGRTFAWDIAFEKRIAELTPEALTAAMRKYIDPKRLSLVRAGDFAKSTGTTAATEGAAGKTN